MKFEPTISLDVILSTLAIVASLGTLGLRISARLAKQEMKLDMMWQWFLKQHKLDVKDKD